MSSLPLLPTSVVGSHGKPSWWFTLVKAHEAGDARSRRPRGDVRRRRRHRHPRHGARRHRRHHRWRGPPPRRLRRLVLRHHQGHPAAAGAPQGRALGLRSADALRGGRPHRDAGGRPRHREGVRVPQGPHRPRHQGHLRRAAHLRLAHPSGQAVQGRRRRGRALRRGHQRRAQGTGRRRRGLDPARRAGARQRLRRGDGPAVQPGHRGREGAAWPSTSASATASAARASRGPTSRYFPGALKARADQFVLEFASRELSEVDLWQKYGERARARAPAWWT